MIKPNNIKVQMERKEFNPVLDKLFKNAGLQTPPKKETHQWAELEGFYQVIAEYIVDIGEQLARTVRLMTDKGYQSNTETNVTIQTLLKDLDHFATRAAAIHDLHKDKVGAVTSGEDVAVLLQIFNDYQLLHEMMRGVFFPSLMTLTESLDSAMKSEKNMTEEQDPSVVTDVEIKETTTNGTVQ
jgi:hypothetical protein